MFLLTPKMLMGIWPPHDIRLRIASIASKLNEILVNLDVLCSDVEQEDRENKEILESDEKLNELFFGSKTDAKDNTD